MALMMQKGTGLVQHFSLLDIHRSPDFNILKRHLLALMLMIFMFMQIQYTGDMCKLLARIHFTEVPQRQCLVQVEWESFFSESNYWKT